MWAVRDWFPTDDLRSLRRWALRGGSSVIDQVIISGTNFMINILVARWLGPSEYGIFAIGFTIFLIVAGFINSFILEPVSVLGPANYADNLNEYFQKQVWFHLPLTGLIGAVLLGIGWILAQRSLFGPEIRIALQGAAIMLPFVSLFWLQRRFAYVLHVPKLALRGSVVYAAIGLLGVVVLRISGLLTVMATFSLLALSGLVAAISLMLFLSPIKPPSTLRAQLSLTVILRDHWRYGKWLGISSLLYSATGQIQTLLLGVVGLAAAGALRAMQNLAQPMVQATTSISLLTLPILSSDYGKGRIKAMRRKGRLITLLLTGAALVYELFLVGFYPQLERLLYGGKYAEFAVLIPILGLVPVATAIATGFSLLLRAEQWSQHYLYTTVVSATVGLASALILIGKWGVWGAAISIVLGYAAGSAATIALYLRRPSLPRMSGSVEKEDD